METLEKSGSGSWKSQNGSIDSKEITKLWAESNKWKFLDGRHARQQASKLAEPVAGPWRRQPREAAPAEHRLGSCLQCRRQLRCSACCAVASAVARRQGLNPQRKNASVRTAAPCAASCSSLTDRSQKQLRALHWEASTTRSRMLSVGRGGGSTVNRMPGYKMTKPVRGKFCGAGGGGPGLSVVSVSFAAVQLVSRNRQSFL